ncbi:MAG: hypothetical protein R2873_29985 [Caldilineaceae bacterium]
MTAAVAPSEEAVLQRALAGTEHLSAADVKILQRTVGNRAMSRFLHPAASIKPDPSAKLSLVQRAGGKGSTGTTPFTGKGHRLGEGTFENDEERDKQRRLAYEKAQSRYSAGLAPFETKTDTVDTSSPTTTAPTTTSPTTTSPESKSFGGEGHRLSEWTFESDDERDSERRSAYATAQSRYSSGLAPFEGESDTSPPIRARQQRGHIVVALVDVSVRRHPPPTSFHLGR